ncbi:hypothetical protein GCM10025331_73050 [Actinoplanes utahensis]|uniref:Histidine kinase/HSP90-like ATPase domain-containing protein n=1 Tax=Actinoplanes utahensis TaxID=1869 RepID=A0A0A6UDC9_ACTUT|nr:hypothetical protein MB27_33615 [Actinoplanes utahensis]GIF33800.1 hypothetical protein Aut01nite_67860 [Actinoplanes utahensis]
MRTLLADRPAGSAARRQVRTVGAGHGLQGDSLYRFELAVHEAMINAVNHGAVTDSCCCGATASTYGAR